MDLKTIFYKSTFKVHFNSITLNNSFLVLFFFLTRVFLKGLLVGAGALLTWAWRSPRDAEVER